MRTRFHRYRQQRVGRRDRRRWLQPRRPAPVKSVLDRLDVDDAATTTPAELHVPGSQCKQRVVTTAADVQPGVEVRAALADDDLASVDELATEALHAEPLRV